MQAGVIGLGAMGKGIAVNLFKAGMLGAVWNRTREVAENFVAGAPVPMADDIETLAALCDVIFISVSADRDVLDIINTLSSCIQPGAIVIDTSTVSISTAQQAGEIITGSGGEFLDAPVSGGSEGAQNGTLAVMVGGNADTVSRAMPALEAISARVIHMGETGTGQATKAVNQIMAAGINQAVTEALAFGQATGLDMDKVVDVVSGGAAGNWFVSHRGKTMVRGVFEPGFKVCLHHKDLKICRDMAEQLGSSLPVVDKTLSDYQQLMNAGYADEDISALFRVKSGLFKN